MPKLWWRRFGNAEDANTLMNASIVQALLALFGLIATVVAALGFWKAPGHYGWSVVLFVVGVPWMLLGVFGHLLAGGGNYIRYICWMWLSMVVGALVLVGTGVVAVISFVSPS